MKWMNRDTWVGRVMVAMGIRPASSTPPTGPESEVPTSLLKAWEELNRPIPEPGTEDAPSSPPS